MASGSGQFVERLHGGFTGVNGLFAKLELHHHLDQATDQDHPESHESSFGAEPGRGNQLAGAYNGGGKNETRSQETQALPESDRGGEDVLSGELIRVIDDGFLHDRIAGLNGSACKER